MLLMPASILAIQNELSGLVLFVADFFQPVNNFAVELFLNGDVRHGRSRRRPMPMLLARREPITSPG